jgi:hypothetical protein
VYIDKISAAPAALIQNPLSPTPKELARDMVMIEVMHYDFHGKIKQGRIVVHCLVANDVRTFFKEAFALEFPIYSVIPVRKFNWQDWASCAANNSSGHNMRHLEDGRMSKHGIGCAFDINPLQNPCYVLDDNSQMLTVVQIIPSDGKYEIGTPGTLQKGDALVKLMVELGWAWGGNWTFPKDFQHFQIVPPELASYVD